MSRSEQSELREFTGSDDALFNPTEEHRMLRELVENDRVIVTKWTFAPGAETGDHVHGHDYVVVPLTTGKLRLVEPTGVRDVELVAGGSYARLTGVAHNVININSHEFAFVVIELK